MDPCTFRTWVEYASFLGQCELLQIDGIPALMGLDRCLSVSDVVEGIYAHRPNLRTAPTDRIKPYLNVVKLLQNLLPHQHFSRGFRFLVIVMGYECSTRSRQLRLLVDAECNLMS
jgi:hypothetical protein